MQERITSARDVARRLGLSHTAIQKAEQVGRIRREADGSWDVERVRGEMIASAAPGRSPLGVLGEATPLGRLTLARLASALRRNAWRSIKRRAASWMSLPLTTASTSLPPGCAMRS